MARKATTPQIFLPATPEWPVAPIELPENPDITVGVYMLSPEVAQLWYDSFNSHNRNFVPDRAVALSVDIDAGDWRLNGEALKFGIDPDTSQPVILDGQHRMYAIGQGTISVPIGIWTGLEVDSQETMDIGAKRTFGDFLALRKVPNAIQVAALVSRIYVWEHGNMRNHQTRSRATIAQLMRKWQHLPDLSDHISIGKSCSTRLHAPQSLFALCSYVFSEVERNQQGGPTDPERPNELVDTDHFFDKLIYGRDLKDGDPVLALRTMFQANANRQQKYGDVHLLALMIKGWNAYRNGKPATHLVWRAGGQSPEAFPIPV